MIDSMRAFWLRTLFAAAGLFWPITTAASVIDLNPEHLCSKDDSRARRDPPRLLSLDELVSHADSLILTVADLEKRAASWDEWLAMWAWVPKLEVSGILAPSPDIKCLDDECITTTNPSGSNFRVDGVMVGVKAKVLWPLYGFGKRAAIKKASAAAAANVEVEGQKVAQDLRLRVHRAYWGHKTARGIIQTICEGRLHLTKEEARITDALARQGIFLGDHFEKGKEIIAAESDGASDTPRASGGQGSAEDDEEAEDISVGDLLRVRVFLARVDARLAEAAHLLHATTNALSLLVSGRGHGIAADSEPLAIVSSRIHPVEYYLAIAEKKATSIRQIDAAIRAREAMASLEKAKFFPNIALVGTFKFSRATGVDVSRNAFFFNPFNLLTGSIGLAFLWEIDPVRQYGNSQRALRLRDATRKKRRLVRRVLHLEVRRAHGSLRRDLIRSDHFRKAVREARTWLRATLQNIAAGAAESKELTEVLPVFLEAKISYLKAVNDVNFGWSRLLHSVGENHHSPLASKDLK